ncbi:unnamed protein product [Didymodactylos carnosus]|uniref:Uncharacterized protein n=1 Tax=Didymodactylos carnosus TaxID=1234261 RepID=A0A8S2E604_9BILA|nr:unnamed protein product [Didymodactylos carnosus]CAF3841475.1 unnamed protein product [Didymodactylos carnosus]
MKKLYGDIFQFWIGANHYYVFWRPEYAQQIYADHNIFDRPIVRTKTFGLIAGTRQHRYRARQRQLLYAPKTTLGATTTDINNRKNNDTLALMFDQTSDDANHESDSYDTDESSEKDNYSNSSSPMNISDQESESDNEDDCSDQLIYENAPINVSHAVLAIKCYIAECKLPSSHQRKLLDLIFLLLPKNNNLNRRRLFKLRKPFIYKILCNNCTNLLNMKTNECLATCRLNGKVRSEDGIIEQCFNNLKDSICDVTQRNLYLIISYPSNVATLLPNDIINGDKYRREASTRSLNLSLQLHSDGIDMLNTKHKNCYATIGTILEIPPPLHDHVKNKLVLSLYLEPSTELVQGDKNDQPCRAMKWKISQFNGYDCCTNGLIHGETRGSNFVYYPYSDQGQPRTHDMFVKAAKLSQAGPGQIAIVQGIKGLSSLLKIFSNVNEDALFDYIHAVCGSSGHMGYLLRKWFHHVKPATAAAMSDFIMEIMQPHDIKVSLKPFSAFDWWKSKDIKFFLLYLSMPMAIKLLPVPISDYFVLFFIAMR